MESTEGVQFGLDDRLSSTLPELRKELQQLLAQEDRFITKYERVHNVLHANERKMRTATAEVIFVVLQVFKDIASEEMKRLSTIVKEVVARRREVLNEVSHDIPVLAGLGTYKGRDRGVGKGRGNGG